MKNTHNITNREYRKLHYWLRNKYGKADKCQNKECKGISKNYEWALQHNCEYERERKNFLMLCKSCHSSYDITDKTKEKLRKYFTNRKQPQWVFEKRHKPVSAWTIDDKFIETFPSINHASRKLGMHASYISKVLAGTYYHTYGYKFKYEQRTNK